MAWTVEYTEAVRRSLRKLDRQSAQRIVDFLDYRVAGLESPRRLGEALTGPLTGYWKYRVGDYRIICEIRDRELVILAVRVGNRRDIYRRAEA